MTCICPPFVVDGKPLMYDGHATPPDTSALLYNVSGLSRGSHKVQLMNAPTSITSVWIDVDYIVFQDSDSSSSTDTVLPMTPADDTDKAFAYFPSPSDWETISDTNSLGDSITRTQSRVGEVEFTFIGETVALYGRVGPHNGAFMCSVDNGAAMSLTAYSVEMADRQVLCLTNNLEKEKKHTLRAWNRPNGDQVWLEIDSAQVWGQNA